MFAMDAVRTGGGGSHGSLWPTCFPLRLRLLLPITLIIDWSFTGNSFGGALAILGGTHLRNSGYKIDLVLEASILALAQC